MAAALSLGFPLAVNPFEYFVVSLLHMAFGILLDAELPVMGIAEITGISLIGNLIGGVGIVGLSHASQSKGEIS